MADPIHEGLPGVVRWAARHLSAGIDSGSAFSSPRVCGDPIAPPEGIDALDDRGIAEILLTNRHHTRSAFDLSHARRIRGAERR